MFFNTGFWILDTGYSILDFVLRISPLGARGLRRMLDNLMLDA
jgi:hypothetical protein